MAVDETRLALLDERVTTLVGRVEAHHERIHRVENVAGNTDVQVGIMKEKVKRHEEILTGDGKVGLTEQMRNVSTKLDQLSEKWEEDHNKKEEQSEKGSNRRWDFTIAVILYIVTRFLEKWFLG